MKNPGDWNQDYTNTAKRNKIVRSPLYSSREVAEHYNLHPHTVWKKLRATFETTRKVGRAAVGSRGRSKVYYYTKEQVEQLFGPWGKL